jgi:6-phosphogluconolactonase (cycloisomerase 2 family)
VTPSNSFTGTVALTCSVTSPAGAVSATTCGLSSTSVSITGTTAQTATLTAATTSATTPGTYQVTVTGTSGSTSETTSVCVAVGTSSSSCNSSATSSGNFYILNSTTISGYSITTGALTALTNSPYALPAGVTPLAIAVDPTGSFLYVSSNAGIFLYDIGAGGALTLAQSGSVLGDLLAYAIKVDSTGNWLLDASGQGSLFAYPINSKTGIPSATNTPPSVSLAAVSVQQMAFSADNNLIAVAEGSAGTQMFTFTAGNTTSPFATVYKVPIKGVAVAVAFSPQTSFLYIGETGDFSSSTDSGGLRILPITSDVPGSEPTASPYPSGGTGPHSILAATNGYVYVANWVGTSFGNITPFLLNASGPTLTLQSNSPATGVQPYGVVEDSSDSFVLAVSYQGNPEFNAFTFDATTTGQLDSSLTGSTGANPIAIVAVP